MEKQVKLGELIPTSVYSNLPRARGCAKCVPAIIKPACIESFAQLEAPGPGARGRGGIIRNTVSLALSLSLALPYFYNYYCHCYY